MHVAAVVGEGDRVEKLTEDVQAPLVGPVCVRERVACGEVLDDRLERLALHAPHDEVKRPVVIHAHVVDRNDVRMLESTDRTDLVDEASHGGGAPSVGAEAFDGHLATDVLVDRGDDFADAALAERALRLEARPRGADEQRAVPRPLDARKHRGPRVGARRDGRGVRKGRVDGRDRMRRNRSPGS